MYKGLSAALLRESTYSTLRIGLYDPIKQLLSEPTLINKIIAGGLSGMIGSAISNPTDLIKIKLQAEKNLTIFTAFKDTVKKNGFFGLYRGTLPTTARAILLTSSQLPAYDQSKKYLLPIMSEGLWLHFTCSMISGIVCCTVASPIDVIKSRYMNGSYRNVGDCIVATFKEGPLTFFRGWVPSWFKLGPHTVITFIVLEKLRALSGLEPIR